MIHSRTWMLALPALAGCLAWTSLGCGGTEPASTPQPSTPTSAETPAEAPKVARGKKAVNPTSEMGLEELRAFKRQQREKGATP